MVTLLDWTLWLSCSDSSQRKANQQRESQSALQRYHILVSSHGRLIVPGLATQTIHRDCFNKERYGHSGPVGLNFLKLAILCCSSAFLYYSGDISCFLSQQLYKFCFVLFPRSVLVQLLNYSASFPNIFQGFSVLSCLFLPLFPLILLFNYFTNFFTFFPYSLLFYYLIMYSKPTIYIFL